MVQRLFLSAFKIMSKSTEIHININFKYLSIHNVDVMNSFCLNLLTHYITLYFFHLFY